MKLIKAYFSLLLLVQPRLVLGSLAFAMLALGHQLVEQLTSVVLTVAINSREISLDGVMPVMKCSLLEVTQTPLAHNSLAPCNPKETRKHSLSCAKALEVSGEQH